MHRPSLSPLHLLSTHPATGASQLPTYLARSGLENSDK